MVCFIFQNVRTALLQTSNSETLNNCYT